MLAPSGNPSTKKETTEFDDWPIEVGPKLTSAEARKIRAFVRSYRNCFAFSLHDLEGYKGKPIRIQLEDDHPISDGRTDLVHLKSWVIKLDVKNYWQRK